MSGVRVMCATCPAETVADRWPDLPAGWGRTSWLTFCPACEDGAELLGGQIVNRYSVFDFAVEASDEDLEERLAQICDLVGEAPEEEAEILREEIRRRAVWRVAR